jgi:hypothetical protein
MFRTLRLQWHNLTQAKPGRRFQNRYYARKRRRTGPFVKALYIAGGAVLMVLGIVLLPAPGPGALVLLLGAAITAQESLAVARLCDAAEIRARRLLRRIRKRV